MGIDVQGNVYRWNSNSVEKFDAVQQLYYRNGNLSFGSIKKLDLTQPQKPFIFFEETQRIVFLDNTLSEQSESIELQTLIPQSWITQVSGSKMNGFWCYDHLNLKVIRLDRYGNVLFIIENLPQFNALSDWDAMGMIEHKNHLYIWDHQNLFLFDLLGGYFSQYPAKHAQYWFDEERVYQETNHNIEQILPLKKTLQKQPVGDTFCFSQGWVVQWNESIQRFYLE